MTYRSFDTGTWKDPWFEGLSPHAKLLFIYLWTNDTVKQSGIYQISQRRMEFELGFLVPEYMAELAKKVHWDEENQTVWVKNFCKRQCANPKFFIGAVKSLEGIPLELQEQFVEYNRIFFDKYNIDTVSIPYAKGIDTYPISDTGSGSDTVSGTEEIHMSPEGDEPAQEPPQLNPSNNGIPYDGILAIYHKTLSGSPKVRVFGETRQKMLKARWQEAGDRQSLTWWNNFFDYVAASDFLTGKTEQNFTADFEWLITKNNLEKVLNGRYENRGRNKHAGIDQWLKIKQQQMGGMQ